MRLDSTMIQTDQHMHTEFSTDSSAPVRSMLDGAVSRGLRTVCITDHLDLDYPPDRELGEKPFLFDIEEYFRYLAPVADEYRRTLTVRTGVEIGLQPHLGERYSDIIQKNKFDFVIGSVHLVQGMDPYYGEVFEGKMDAQAYREAFEETAGCIRAVRDFDVLGHLDYVVRYGKHKAAQYSYRRFSDEIDEILKILISSGKGLEMNMGGVKYGLGFCNPHPDVLRRYRELGGEIITVGSDAHQPEHVGYAFEVAADILKSCGFRYFTEFSERRPSFIPVP